MEENEEMAGFESSTLVAPMVTASGNLTSSNTTKEEDIQAYIASILGDPRLDLKTLIPLTSIYLLFMILGVMGNLATCLVILNNEYMRTATNVYLFNLAIADIATLVIMMPGELYLMWRQYPWLFGELACDLKIIITEGVIYASILTIVAFTIERYLAICHPLSSTGRSSTGKAKKVVGGVWLASFISASPWAYYSKVNYVKYEGRELMESAWCHVPFNEKDSKIPLYLMAASTVIYFLIPLAVVTVLYLKIGLTMKYSKMKRCAASCDGQDCKAERTLNQGRRTVIRMLIAVVVAFFACWSPFHSQRLMFVSVTLYGEWTERLRASQHVLFMFSGVFYYFNSTLNPILYSVMSKRFRRGFTDIRRGLVLCSNPGPRGAETRKRGDTRPRHWIPKEQRDQILLRALGCSGDRADREVLSCSQSSSERWSNAREDRRKNCTVRFQDRNRMERGAVSLTEDYSCTRTQALTYSLTDNIISSTRCNTTGVQCEVQTGSEGILSSVDVTQGRLSHWSNVHVISGSNANLTVHTR